MNFLSNFSEIFSEFTCFTDPEPESSIPIRNVRLRRESSSKGNYEYSSRETLGQKSNNIGSNVSQGKYNHSHPAIPSKTNKLAEYLQGEVDIVCFAPTQDDYSSTYMRYSADELIQNTTDEVNDDNDLIYVDIGDKLRQKNYSAWNSDEMRRHPKENFSSYDHHNQRVHATSSNHIETDMNLNRMRELNKFPVYPRRTSKMKSHASKNHQDFSTILSPRIKLSHNTTDEVEDGDLIYDDVINKLLQKDSYSVRNSDEVMLHPKKGFSRYDHPICTSSNNVEAAQNLNHMPDLNKYSSIKMHTSKIKAHASSESQDYSSELASRIEHLALHNIDDCRKSLVRNHVCPPRSEIRKDCDMNDMSTLYIDTERPLCSITMKYDSISPASVISSFPPIATNPAKTNNIDFELLNEGYGRDNIKSSGSLIDSVYKSYLDHEKRVKFGHVFNFESAGFSADEASMIKRRIKLQKLIRGIV